MARNDKTIYINACITHTTEKAIQIKPAYQEEKFWLPKSQVVNIDELMDYLTTMPQEDAMQEYIELECKEWIVQKNGIPDGYKDSNRRSF